MKIRVRPSNNGIRIGENTQNQLIVLNPNTFAVAKINVRNIKNTDIKDLLLSIFVSFLETQKSTQHKLNALNYFYLIVLFYFILFYANPSFFMRYSA